MPHNDANFGIGTLVPNTSFRRERRTSIVLAFDAAVLDGDAVVLDLIHFTQPMAECRNEIRMDPAMRLEEPDRRPAARARRAATQAAAPRYALAAFHHENSTRLIGVYPAVGDQKLAYSPGDVQAEHVVQPRTDDPTTDLFDGQAHGAGLCSGRA